MQRKQKLVYGWGINDADYVVQPTEKGKQTCCPYYRVWHDMVKRCHYPKYQKRFPTYKVCKISLEWKFFMTFRAWMKIQDYKDKQLDKDIFGDKLYSPKTCCFVEQWLNSLFNDCGAKGKWSVGVSCNGQKFRARICINGKITLLKVVGNEPQEMDGASSTTAMILI